MLKSTFAALESVAKFHGEAYDSNEYCAQRIVGKTIYDFYDPVKFMICQFKSKGFVEKIESLIGRYSVVFRFAPPEGKPDYTAQEIKRRKTLGKPPGL